MYQAFIGVLLVIIISIIAAIPLVISIIKYNSILKKSLVNTTSMDGSSFAYKSKNYDKETYINLRMKSIKNLSLKELEPITKKAYDKLKSPDDAGIAQAELEAIERIKKYHESRLDEYRKTHNVKN